MCGIVGYIGSKQALPILVDGLRGLSYRGYDSAGIAIPSNGGLTVRKRQGKISVLEESLAQSGIEGRSGIGHTRWATHGVPNEQNAHPHRDCKGQIAVVHNGIVENFTSLRERLLKEGHTLSSQTDTELLAHLIESFYDGDLEGAVRKALQDVVGTYALAVVHTAHPDELIGARKGSPLVLGVGEGEYFIASDILAFLRYTREAIYLEDGEIAILKKGAVTLHDENGRSRQPEPFTVEWNISLAQKGGFPHYMLKEIHEQPTVLKQTLAGRIKEDGVTLEKMDLSKALLQKVRRIHLFSCGTAWHAALVAKYYLEQLAQIPCEVDVSSEFRYREPLLGPDSLAIPISQSGETADTLASLRLAKEKGAKTLAICNVVGSSIAREADAVLYTYAGPEIAVPSTKAYTTQLSLLFLLAIYLGRLRNALTRQRAKQLLKELASLQKKASGLLSQKGLHEIAQECGKRYSSVPNFLFLGRGVNFPTALEGALKLKELSYIHAEGYGAGEMKHGPIALISEKLPIVCIAPQSRTYDKMFSNIQECRARRGIIISIATEGDPTLSDVSEHVLHVPPTEELLSPILTVIPLQLLSYYLSVAAGCDVDQPRNLAKSVTVE